MLSLLARSVILSMVAAACQAREADPVAESRAAPKPTRTAPVVAATRYRLVSVDTLPLPDSTACGASIATSGELALRDDGTWTSRERAQYSCARPVSVVTDSGTFVW